MSDSIKKLYQFAVFFNVFIFILYVVSSNNITSIPIRFKVGLVTVRYNVNLITLIFAILAIYGIIIIVGGKVFGSGVSEESLVLMRKLTAYVLIWIIGSIFMLSFLSPLESLGQLIFGILSVGYTLGFLQSMSLKED